MPASGIGRLEPSVSGTGHLSVWYLVVAAMEQIEILESTGQENQDRVHDKLFGTGID